MVNVGTSWTDGGRRVHYLTVGLELRTEARRQGRRAEVQQHQQRTDGQMVRRLLVG
jgi:hypothetical protein